MQVIAVLAENHVALSSVDPGLLGKVDSKDIEIALIKNFKLLLQALLVIPEELPSQRLRFRNLLESLTLPSRVSKNMSPHSMNRSLTWDTRVSV